MKLLIKPLLGLLLLSIVSCSNTDTPENENNSDSVILEETNVQEDTLGEISEEFEVTEEIAGVEIDLTEMFEIDPVKDIPVYSDFQIIEKTTGVYIEEVMEEAQDKTYSVLLTGEVVEELAFDSTALAEIDLNNLKVDSDSLLNVTSCFRINGYIVIQCLTKRNEYNNSDWIIIHKDGEAVWNTVARHYDSCEDNFADIVGVVSVANHDFLMISHVMNSLSFVEIGVGFQEQYLYNSRYDPNVDYGM